MDRFPPDPPTWFRSRKRRARSSWIKCATRYACGITAGGRKNTYVHWIRRFIIFHHKKHPSTMGAPEIAAFLSWLATGQRVSSSTQNQALSAPVVSVSSRPADRDWRDRTGAAGEDAPPRSRRSQPGRGRAANAGARAIGVAEDQIHIKGVATFSTGFVSGVGRDAAPSQTLAAAKD